MSDDALAKRLESLFIWEQLPPEDRLDFLLSEQAPDQWFTDTAMATLSHFRDDAQAWGRILAVALTLRLSPARVEAAVDSWRAKLPSSQASSPAIHVSQPPLVSPLPASAQCAKSWGHCAAWIERYIAHSQRWSPRAIQGAHQAVALWVLSTVAARRVYCQVGSSQVFPVMFLAMVARSTLYAKSTTAAVGRDVLKRSGCDFLLTADRTTPQALIRSMAGIVPQNYGSVDEDRQALIRQRLAFAGQRGAYFEEWGGMLSQMRRSDSPMADFHTLLRVLDDNQASYGNETIQRGLEYIPNPYLALLASATPHDLAPFMAPGSAWWHDGFWPRFAIITPGPDETPSLMQRERTGYTVPGTLIQPLHDWHTRLGIPSVEIEAASDAKGKATGAWDAMIGQLPQQELDISAEVYDAYEAYNTGLLMLLQSGDVVNDFDASYGRCHEKALRIALLLASLEGAVCIDIQHWAYAQHCVEGWRRNLHALTARIEASHPLTQEEQLEQKILTFLARAGAATARTIQRECHLKNSAFTKTCLDALVKVGHLSSEKAGRQSIVYSLLPEEGVVRNDIVPSNVPF